MLKPVHIMEGALARRLRARPALNKRGLWVVHNTDGVLICDNDNKVVGLWRWSGRNFAYHSALDGPVVFEAQTLMAAMFYTSSVLCD